MTKGKALIITLAWTLILLAVAITAADALGQSQPARSSVVGLVGATTPGLGTPAGVSIGADVRLSKEAVEIASRTIATTTQKIGSGGRSITERLILRYGRTWFVGGGVFIGHIAGINGRTAIAPLIHGGYRWTFETGDVIGYVSGRFAERGTNHTRDHATRGAEFAIEARRFIGRWVITVAAGSEYLTFRNVDDPAARHGAKGFVRIGAGIRF